ncbi:MAG: hypothetical protein J7M25_07590 [Deltaproteobacteria bacterium]|nr:hypothetical protein [Deltaproteobacteria bacterium]
MSQTKSIGQTDKTTRKPIQWLGLAISAILGLVFLVAGVLKVYDPTSFYVQIRGYQLVGHLPAKIAAMALPPIEVALGLAAIIGPKRKLALVGIVSMLVLFLAATGHAWLYGTTDNCGCFGEFVAQSPKTTFFEDSVMLLAGLGGLFISERSLRPRFRPWMRYAALGTFLVAGLAVSLLRGSWAISDKGKLRPGRVVTNWHLKELDSPGYQPKHIHPNLKKGTHIVVFFSPSCKHCWMAVPDVNALVRAHLADSTFALAHDHHPDSFFQFFVKGMHDRKADYPIMLMPWRIYKHLNRSVPRTVIIKTGAVRMVVDGVPSVTEMKALLR